MYNRCNLGKNKETNLNFAIVWQTKLKYFDTAKSKELYCVEWTISISKCPDDDHRWSVKLVGLNKNSPIRG